MSVPVCTISMGRRVAEVPHRVRFIQNQHYGNDAPNGRNRNLADSCHDTLHFDARNTDICHEIHTCLDETSEVYKPQKR